MVRHYTKPRIRWVSWWDPGRHGMPLVSREAIYEWMIRWLKDGQGDFHEQPVKMYTNRELLVTKRPCRG